MPNIAFGTWKVEATQAKEVIREAITTGYRHIDTAAAYANEDMIGQGIRQSKVAREDLYISGKLWTSKRAYNSAIKACRRSLKNLDLDYFDQYLLHWPAPTALYSNWREMNAETWRAMETLKQEGLVRCIGVCNFKPSHIEALAQYATWIPEVNQIECHPGYMQLETLDYCKGEKIKIEAWSPLGNGSILAHPTLVKISEYYNRSVAQICLRWCLQHDVVPITKSIHSVRMKSNLQIFDFELSREQMVEIDSMPLLAYSGLDPDTVTQFG